MSMKLRASLEDNYRSKMEQSYMRKEDVITLKKVPCEMKFQAISGWVEHEGEEHHYLPLFHLNGFIKEIRGNFPYNVSSLNFDEDDVNKHLQRDILYYMSPDEMAHMIKVGKFYTDDFELPGILTGSEYDFPVLVDLTIVPPPNPVAYEQASYGLGMTDANRDGIDRTNLPMFYVSFQGTGIDRKKDKLLDYYGIDFDQDYPMYTLTAESSGYTQPTLMEYITAPVVEKEAGTQLDEDLYLTPEDEARMLQAREAQAQAQTEQMYHPEEDYQLTEEDVLLTQADRNIEERIAMRMRELSKENNGPSVEQQRQAQAQMQSEQMRQKEQEQQQTKEPVAFEALQSFMKKEPVVQTEHTPKQMVDETKATTPVVEETKEEPLIQEEPVTEIQQSAKPTEDVYSVKEEVVQEVEDTSVNQEDVTTNPDAPESYKHIEAVVKNEADAVQRMNDHSHEDSQDEQDAAGLEVDEDEFSKLRDAQGADVSDASLQVKVDEANVRENARQVAVGMQTEMHNDGSADGVKSSETHPEVNTQKPVDKTGRAEQKTDKSHRDVGSLFEDLANRADAQQEAREKGDMGE